MEALTALAMWRLWERGKLGGRSIAFPGTTWVGCYCPRCSGEQAGVVGAVTIPSRNHEHQWQAGFHVGQWLS